MSESGPPVIPVEELVERIREGIPKRPDRRRDGRSGLVDPDAHLARFSLLRDVEELRELNRSWALEPHSAFSSHRRFVGPAVVGAKRRFQNLVIRVLEGYFTRERSFLANLVRLQNRLVSQVDHLIGAAHNDDQRVVARTEVLLERVLEEQRNLETELARLRMELTEGRRPARGEDHVPKGFGPFAAPDSDGERLRLYAPALADSAPVVHVRAGRGELLDALRACGVLASGVEPDEDLARVGRERGLDVTSGTLRIPPGPHGSVAITDTETLPPGSVETLLDEAVANVRPGGLVLVESVHAASYPGMVRLATVGARGTFDPETLRAVLAGAGLVDVEGDLAPGRLPSLPPPDVEIRSPTLARFAENFRILDERIFGPAHHYALGRRPG